MGKLTSAWLCVVLLGCGGGGGGSPERQALARMEAARDQACACKDLPCVEKVKADFKAWVEAHKAELSKVKDQPKAYLERFGGLSDETDACITGVEEAAPGYRPPAPEFVDPPRPEGPAEATTVVPAPAAPPPAPSPSAPPPPSPP